MLHAQVHAALPGTELAVGQRLDVAETQPAAVSFTEGMAYSSVWSFFPVIDTAARSLLTAWRSKALGPIPCSAQRTANSAGLTRPAQKAARVCMSCGVLIDRTALHDTA